MKSKILILSCFLMVSCGSQSDKGSSAPSTPPKPSKPPVASVAPAAPVASASPAIQAAPVAPPTYPHVGGPTTGGTFANSGAACPNGPVRRLFYNIFHSENCVQ